jgi:beta-galactosidase
MSPKGSSDFRPMSWPTSRRSFLKEGTAGLSLAWGGLRLFAGPQGVEGPTGSTANQTEFIYGSEVYRPPNPPRSMRREVFRTIAQEHHFGLIRCYPTWDYYQVEPDRFQLEEIEEVMRYSDEFGLKVLMGVVLETMPYWLEQAHPEARFVDGKGQPQILEARSAQITGGCPGLCLDWEPVREAARRFIGELVKTVAPHPSMYAWDIWNEPKIPALNNLNIWATPQERLFCYCTRTVAEFRKWLQKRYGAIEQLNEAWTRRYPNWEAINPPRSMGVTEDWVDWRRFMIDRSTEEMRFRISTLRSFDSKHQIECHCSLHPPFAESAIFGVNFWRLAEQVDIWGLTLFPHQPNTPPSLGAGRIEITRSNAGGKDFWVTELQAGDSRIGLVDGGFTMRPRDIRFWNWLGVAAGAKGVIYWQYMPEATGRESTRHGLVERDGSSTDRCEEAVKNHRLLQEHWDLIKEYRPKPQVALMFDQDNALLTFALAGKESVSTNSFIGYYQALWNQNLWVDFIEPASVAKTTCKVLIVPWHPIGKRETCDALRRYAESGGTLILESPFGLFDERFYYNPVIPPHGLTEVFGYREEHNYLIRPEQPTPLVSASERIYYQPNIEFTAPIPIRVKAHTLLTPLKLSSATPIATCQGMTVAAMKKVGQGQVIYLGTNLGAAIAAGDANAMKLLHAIVASVVKPEVTAANLRPRLMRGASKALLTVFNDTAQDQTARIEVPKEFRQARDIHSGKEQVLVGHTVLLTVPHQDVAVLQLT